MNVSELIEELKKLPKNLEIFIDEEESLYKISSLEQTKLFTRNNDGEDIVVINTIKKN